MTIQNDAEMKEDPSYEGDAWLHILTESRAVDTA